MAFPAPAAVFLDENLPIHRGKMADGLNARPLKPSVKPSARKEGPAGCVQHQQAQAPTIQKGHPLKDRSILKDKSALCSQDAITDRGQGAYTAGAAGALSTFSCRAIRRRYDASL